MAISEPPTATAHPIDDDAGVAMSNLPIAMNVSSVNAPYAPPLPPTITMNAGAGLEIPMHEQQKLGAICCGFCCDFRRAVIMVNSLIIAMSSLALFSGLLNPPVPLESIASMSDPMSTLDDDQVLNEFNQINQTENTVNMIIGGVVMILTVFPLYGAYSFRTPFIAFGVVLLVATFVADFTVSYFLIEDAASVSDEIAFSQPFVLYTLTAIVTALYIYAHVGLILEIQQGIMTAETYVREDYCCYCSTSRSRPQDYSNYGGITGYR